MPHGVDRNLFVRVLDRRRLLCSVEIRSGQRFIVSYCTDSVERANIRRLCRDDRVVRVDDLRIELEPLAVDVDQLEQLFDFLLDGQIGDLVDFIFDRVGQRVPARSIRRSTRIRFLRGAR